MSPVLFAVDDMHRQTEFLQRAQGGGRDHVAAMQHRLGTVG